MKLRSLRPALLAAGILCTASFPALAQTAPPDFFFRDGDRIQILGDSITQQAMYSTLMESYVLSRFPQWKVTVRNTGWSGDTMGLRLRKSLDTGFKRDLEPLQSTAVTIDFGMNDARAGDAGKDAYMANARTLVDKFKTGGTRIALITSSPEEKYEPGQPAGSAYNNTLRSYSEGLQAVAAEKGVVFVDQLNPMITVLESGRQAGVLSPTQGGPRLINDAVHPQWGGHLIMATTILKGLKAPSLVSRVALDARTGTVQAENATVTGVQTADGLSFTRADNALPWPIPSDPTVLLALKIPGFTPLADLSRYELQVSNLAAPKYQVSVDGTPVGTYTREELAGGVNLSSMQAGPIYDQDQALLKKVMDKNSLFFNRWRNVQIFEAPAWLQTAAEPIRAAELKRLDDQIAAAETEINGLRQPKPHVWSLKPVA
jgi:lysophospholipase L1-like esterase